MGRESPLIGIYARAYRCYANALVCVNAAAQDKKADKKKKTAEVTFVVSMF
ncbi:hypothetical protein Barb4_02375 [Bacteroidales bacterium Barb4]|nr:hypothetical protein Barb4_02375 [Bacteroidales bacterium Barb4]